jgi:hypothetical protein
MNERLTIRNPHFEIFTWLPIGRCDADHGSDRRDPDGKPMGVLKTIKGNTGAIRTTAGDGFFSPQARGLKEDARSSALAEKDFTFYVKRFL